MDKDNWPQVIVHADLDAFYASVEQLDDPSLRGLPLLVGPRSGRGVVLTASYEARPYGVGSAMPMVQALRRCPDAVVVPPRFERYQELSAAVMSVFYDYSPHVEAISLDEAFLDMSGTEHIFGDPGQLATSLQQAVFAATGGLTISVGVGVNKYVAKVASGYAKPNGITLVSASEMQAWLAPQPVSRLWGAGPKTQSQLQARGYFTIGDVASAPLTQLKSEFGSMGLRFHELANGRDQRQVARRPVEPVPTNEDPGARWNRPGAGQQRVRSHSISSERTLTTDLADQRAIQAHLARSADRVARRLRRNQWHASGVRVKLKTHDFKSLSRQSRCAPTDSAEDLMSVASRLLTQFEHPGPFRLIGLGVYDLRKVASAPQMDLFAAKSDKRQLEGVLDELSEKFGEGVVQRAKDLTKNTVIHQGLNLDFMQELGADEAPADSTDPEDPDLSP